MAKTKCILCGEMFGGYGHNPEPLASPADRCCDYCNIDVIFERMKRAEKAQACKICGARMSTNGDLMYCSTCDVEIEKK